MINNWHCDYTYQTVAGSLDSYPVVQSSDCYATGTSTTIIENSSTTPLYTQDAGNLIFGIGILTFVVCMTGIIKLLK